MPRRGRASHHRREVSPLSRKLDLPLFAGLLVAALAFTAPQVREGDPDLGWHLATGRYIVEHHAVPHTDPFSYTAQGRPWIAHEWATDVVFYLLDRAWGIRGLVLFRQMTQVLGVVLTYLLCLRAGVHPLAALVGGAGYLFFVIATLNARPQMLLPVYTLLLLHILLSYRQGRRRALWWILPLTVLWANTHGGFLLLFAILAIFIVDQAIDQPEGGLRSGRFAFRPRKALPVVGIAALAAVATLCNPNGLRGSVYPLTYLTGDLAYAASRVQEWQSPDFSAAIHRFPLLALLLAPVLLAMSPVVPNLFQLLLLMFVTLGYLKYQRMVPIFGVVWIWLAAEVLQRRFLKPYQPQDNPRTAPMAVSIFVLAAVLFAAGLPWLKPTSQLLGREAYPAAAVEVAQDNGLSGRLLNTYHYGGYIVWRYYPTPVVFIDGRADVFAGALFNDGLTMMRGKMGWHRLLRQYRIDWAIVQRDEPLSELLRLTPGWHLIYADGVACLFVHDGPANTKVLQRWRAGKLKLPKGAVLPVLRPNS
jgi:hypothetical protein